VRNRPLHQLLEAFTTDAAMQLSADTAQGAEVPFEVIEEPGARAPLYCYRPLIGVFIRERLGLLSALPTYAPAARALSLPDGVDAYLREQGQRRIPTEARERADAALRTFLGSVFGRPGLVLHGETEVKKRKDLVRQFQEDEDVPFFVLSVKAGGTGLNLTAASHVIHFDRWWNPAVENQATDRAFRIGQTKNVLVHKFVCRGTVEEKIDHMIESKKQLAGDFLGGGADILLTEMKDEELLKLVSLDLGAAMKEGDE